MEVEALINKYKLLAATVLVDPDAFTPELEKLLVRYCINVIIPLTSSDGGHGSVIDVESRNPGFEERLCAWPPHKVTILFDTDSPSANYDVQQHASALLSLALSFPKNQIVALRGTTSHDCSGHIREYLWQLAQHDASFAVDNIDFETSLRNRFNILDIQFLKDIGVLGGAVHV